MRSCQVRKRSSQQLKKRHSQLAWISWKKNKVVRSKKNKVNNQYGRNNITVNPLKIDWSEKELGCQIYERCVNTTGFFRFLGYCFWLQIKKVVLDFGKKLLNFFLKIWENIDNNKKPI